MAEEHHRATGPDPAGGGAETEEREEAFVLEATRLSARLIYEVIRRDGEAELDRPFVSLLWSGFAAGILISLSVLGEAIFRANLPDTSGAFLIENLGYSLGFVVVILGRMQLFTENTITTVLPAITRRSLSCFRAMMRLWGVVLGANVLGALLAGWFMTIPGVFSDDMTEAITGLSRHAVGMGTWDSFIRAVPAGVLVASLVWIMPSARGNELLVILAFTWAIAAGDFTHIIAGSVEMGFLLWRNELDLVEVLMTFFLPVLAGNVVGGTAIFTMLAWGQVKNEVRQGRGSPADHDH
ncbi:Formate/nitrite transporter FocA, FNT family [Lutimaribacter pacificus]|uniref:Formate/nitrite transporter FocA, FNT family n=1 Tax=Lutimaribacter pacificus TaxID=391948 RepID=A0A1H0M5G2_9RHOB|nr:formate/nitrite transporter family protein [Lutimaribacter pacificus]SDO75689.1 Formate/nitrite transporter FocA, FNT family [Lutimaribacter pacificus]SHK78013.1 Formate/nitrite transporter FocA, FNT family [Lutimaribacter pacificus]